MKISSPKLRAGVIGLGIGEKHIEGFLAHDSCEVKCIADFNPEKLAEVSGRYPGISTSQSSDDVLSNPEIEVVSIASFDQFHFEQVCLGIDHDKHLFVEKPLCLYESEAEIIFEKLRKKPYLKFSSNLILRRSPRFLELKQSLDAKQLGTIYHAEADYLYGRLAKIQNGWRSEAPYYSVMLGGGVHMIDLLVWLLSDRVESVFSLSNHMVADANKFKHYDHSVGLMQFRKGTVAKVSANFGCVHPHFHQVQIFGSAASFQNFYDNPRIITSRDSLDPYETVVSEYPGVAKGAMLHNFLDVILGIEEKAYVSKEDVFATMAIAFALEKSTLEKRVVKVQYFDE